MRRALLTMTIALVALTATGCSNQTKALKNENALLREENDSLRNQLEDRNAALDATNLELRDREMLLAQSRTEGDRGGATGFEGIEGVRGTMSAGEVTATVESDILFDPGKTTLKSSAKRSLDAVAGVLNSSYSGRPIKIAGHTDTDPIRKSGYKSNYHLAFERSYAVRDYLVSRGVSAGRVYMASHGPNKPRGNKKSSRRVEIIVVLQ